MEVDRQTNLPEERTSECRNLSSDYRYCSQSRKISIGVLVDSITKVETKHLKEPVSQIAGIQANSRGNCVEDGERHTPLLEKHVTIEQKDTSPWVSTRYFNPKGSASVAVQFTERTPSFPVISSRRRPRPKLLEKASAAHSLKFFSARTGIESDACRQKNSGKDVCSMEAGKVNNIEHVEGLLCSTEPGVRLEKEQMEDKERTAENGNHETLRMKLWEILENVSSPNKHFPSPTCVELQSGQERDGKQSPIEEIHPNSNTIESDSQTHIFKRPMTRSLTRSKASTRKQSNKIEATKSIPRRVCPQKRIFSFKGDWSARFYDNCNHGSLPSGRNKILRTSSRVEMHQGCKYGNAEERLQSEKSRSIPVVEKSMVSRNNVFNARSISDRRNGVIVEPKKDPKYDTSFESPLNVMTDQKDVLRPMDVEDSKKNQQEDMSDSFVKNKRNSAHDPSNIHDQGPVKIFNMTGIRSFKSLLSSKSAECKPNVQLEPSDGEGVSNDSPSNGLLVKPRTVMDEDSENRMSKSSSDEMVSESFEDESHNKGIQDNSALEMYLEQNHENGLTRDVALFAVALNRLKTKLKSTSSRKSAEILQGTVEEIFLRVQDAESLIKTDVGRLTNLSLLERNRLQTRLQEKQKQLLGISKRFKEEVDKHLQDYGSLFEDLEEHEIELKRYVDRQRASHKNLLSKVEQEISVQLGDAESKIMIVQELAREKMLQLRLCVAECLKHCAF